MKVDAASLIDQDFHQAGQATGARVRKHKDLRAHFLAGAEGSQRSRCVFVIRPREDAIDGVNKLDEVRGLSITGMRNFHGESRVNVRGIAANSDDPLDDAPSSLTLII